jgi:hypothetical protein
MTNHQYIKLKISHLFALAFILNFQIAKVVIFFEKSYALYVSNCCVTFDVQGREIKALQGVN